MTLQALGMVETRGLVALIEAADAMCKAANVELLEIRLAMALGGKAFVTLTGDVAAVLGEINRGAEVGRPVEAVDEAVDDGSGEQFRFFLARPRAEPCRLQARGQAGPIPPRAGNVCMDCGKLIAALGYDPFDPWPYCDALVPTHAEWHRERPPGEPRSPRHLHRVLATNPNLVRNSA